MSGHVEPDFIDQTQRAHGHSKIKHDAVDVCQPMSFPEKSHSLNHVRQQDAINQKTRAVPDEHGEFSDIFSKAYGGLSRSCACLRTAYNFHQLHPVNRVEEMNSDQALRMLQRCCHGV